VKYTLTSHTPSLRYGKRGKPWIKGTPSTIVKRMDLIYYYFYDENPSILCIVISCGDVCLIVSYVNSWVC